MRTQSWLCQNNLGSLRTLIGVTARVELEPNGSVVGKVIVEIERTCYVITPRASVLSHISGLEPEVIVRANVCPRRIDRGRIVDLVRYLGRDDRSTSEVRPPRRCSITIVVAEKNDILVRRVVILDRLENVRDFGNFGLSLGLCTPDGVPIDEGEISVSPLITQLHDLRLSLEFVANVIPYRV